MQVRPQVEEAGLDEVVPTAPGIADMERLVEVLNEVDEESKHLLLLRDPFQKSHPSGLQYI